MPLNLTTDSQIIRVKALEGAAQTPIESDIVDTAGFDGIAFIAVLGDVANGSVLTLTVEHGDEVGGGDMAATTIAPTYTADASDSDDKMIVAEIIRPQKRYVRAVLTRTVANAEVDAILAIAHGPAHAPLTQGATVIASATALAPATA